MYSFKWESTLFNPLETESVMVLDLLVTSALRDTIGVCGTCRSLIVEVKPGQFEHLDNVCRECVKTPGQCSYPESHGVHEFRMPGRGKVPCLVAEPSQCRFCFREILGTDEEPCVNHRGCCGSADCCDAR